MINTGLGLGQCRVDVQVGYFLLIHAQLKRHTTQFKTTHKINIQEYQFIKFVFFIFLKTHSAGDAIVLVFNFYLIPSRYLLFITIPSLYYTVSYFLQNRVHEHLWVWATYMSEPCIFEKGRRLKILFTKNVPKNGILIWKKGWNWSAYDF